MFLKRLFVTALGALGLVALLASGTASAQQLPAPKVLGSVANCQGTARTAQSTPGRNENRSPLDIILTGGDATNPADTPIARNTAAADIDATEEAQLLTRLAIDTTAALCDENPVAGGYQRAIDLYEAYITAKNALPREDDNPGEESTLERAARLALMDKNAFGGDVYNKVYDLLMKEKTVEDAIDDYNALVGDDGRLAALTTAYNAIGIAGSAFTKDDPDNPGTQIPLTTDDLERVFGEDEIQGYQAIDTNTESSGFNNLGQLQLADAPDTAVTTLGGIVVELQTRESALATATRNLNNAKEAGNLNLAALQEAERRAKVARDHVQSELDRLTAIVRARNVAYADGATIIIGTRDGDDEVVLARNHRQVLTGFGQIGDQVDTAQRAVVNAVKALDSANKGARDAFGNSQQYLNQLVTLREFDQAKAQAAHDEVTNPAPALVSDLEEAKQSTMAAKDLRTTYQNLVGSGEDRTPANKLVDALLVTDNEDEDDDGLAVVQAVADTYQAAKENEGRLDDLLATADDGTESGRIPTLEDKVEMLTGGDDGSSGLGALEDKVNALTAMDDPDTMEDETGAVTQNAEDITGLDQRVTVNEMDLDTVWETLNGSPRGVEAQHDDLAACDATGLVNVAACADARSRHNEGEIGKLTGEEGVIAMGDAETLKAAMAADAEALKAGIAAAAMGDAETLKAANEAAMMGDAETLKAANEAAMAGDAETLKAANEAAMMGDAETLKAANEAAMMGDAETLKAANEAAMMGDAETLKAANEAAMMGDAETLKAANEAAMMGDAETLKAANEAAMAGDAAEARLRTEADDALGMRIDGEATARMGADEALGMRIDSNWDAIAANQEAIMTGAGLIAGNAGDIMTNAGNIASNDSRISSNADAIAANMNAIGQNASAISDNRRMIGELSDDLDVVRAGVAASMALAGMPAINGRGISIGVGSYDGESAFAVGFQIQGEQASFKVGVTSSGGETGASAGVGFNF